MMRNKIYLLFLVLLLIVIPSSSLDSYNRKGDKENEEDSIEDSVVVTGKYNPPNEDRTQTVTNRRDRYSPYGSSGNNHRSRSRWSPPPSSLFYEDKSDYNDRSPYGYNGYDNGAYSNGGPTCHSLLDPAYPLFSDICGSVPQARYSLPNAFGHLERWQIAQTLSILLGPATPSSANPVCSRSLRLLLCPLLFPPCSRRYEAPPVLPCQPFCRAVKAQCAAPSLELLPCDLLPFTSDLCPINPTPFSSLLSSFMPPSPLNGPLPPFGLPPSPLSSLLAQSALFSGLSPFDMPPPGFPSFSAQQGFPTAFPPNDQPPSFFPPGFAPPNAPSPTLASLLASSGMSPAAFSALLQSSPMGPSGIPPHGLASLFSGPGQFSPAAMSSFLTPINPYLTPDPYMADSLNPMLVDFPPLQFMQGLQQQAPPRYYPFTRSATEKV